MLGSYMEDIGITAKEFEAACTQGKSITGKFHQQLFEQVSPFPLPPVLSASHIKCRFGLRMTMRFSRGWWSRRTSTCRWRPWNCYSRGSDSILLECSPTSKSILLTDVQVRSPSWVAPTFKRVSYGFSGRGGQGYAGGDKVCAKLNPFLQPLMLTAHSTKLSLSCTWCNNKFETCTRWFNGSTHLSDMGTQPTSWDSWNKTRRGYCSVSSKPESKGWSDVIQVMV